jgi:hypothetical protein
VGVGYVWVAFPSARHSILSTPIRIALILIVLRAAVNIDIPGSIILAGDPDDLEHAEMPAID